MLPTSRLLGRQLKWRCSSLTGIRRYCDRPTVQPPAAESTASKPFGSGGSAAAGGTPNVPPLSPPEPSSTVGRVFSHVREDVVDLNTKYTRLREQLRTDMHDLYGEMLRRRYNVWAISLSALTFLIAGGYGFWRQWAAEEVSLISSESLRDVRLREEAERFAMALCRSESVQAEVATLLERAVLDVVLRPSVQKMLEDRAVELVRSEPVQAASAQLAGSVVSSLVNEDRFAPMRSDLAQYLHHEAQRQLSDARNTRAASSFIWSTVKTAVGLGPSSSSPKPPSTSSSTASPASSSAFESAISQSESLPERNQNQRDDAGEEEDDQLQKITSTSDPAAEDQEESVRLGAARTMSPLDERENDLGSTAPADLDQDATLTAAVDAIRHQPTRHHRLHLLRPPSVNLGRDLVAGTTSAPLAQSQASVRLLEPLQEQNQEQQQQQEEQEHEEQEEQEHEEQEEQEHEEQEEQEHEEQEEQEHEEQEEQEHGEQEEQEQKP